MIVADLVARPAHVVLLFRKSLGNLRIKLSSFFYTFFRCTNAGCSVATSCWSYPCVELVIPSFVPDVTLP